MDFFKICMGDAKEGKPREIFADFVVERTNDFMLRGQSFYAIWDEERGFWSTDEYDVVRLVDAKLKAFADEQEANGTVCKVRYLRSSSSKSWYQFRTYMKNMSDNSTELDSKVVFANSDVKKSDYCSRRLDYPLLPGPHLAYDELIGTLYSKEERAKLEWAIGSIMAGDSKKIQKFIALYGPAGSGKGTALDIIKKLLPGYYAIFEAKSLVGGQNNFATAAFKSNPLVAIDPDAKLDRIEDNTKLNVITEHTELVVNEKFKAQYTTRLNAMVFVGTNDPVKITDAKSGLIRRLIDIRPSGKLVPVERYGILMAQVDFELGAIAHHCLEVYKSMGKNYYSDYRATSMILETDMFYNFVEAHFDIFKSNERTTLKQAWSLYKAYCEETNLKYPVTMQKLREELKNYFYEYEDRETVNNTTISSVYKRFKALAYKAPVENDPKSSILILNETASLLDDLYSACPAQYAKPDETPEKYWTGEERLIGGVMKAPKPSQVASTVLSDLDTSKLHFVKIPTNHIVIDFDLKGEDGKKSLTRNLRAASDWPLTYAEISNSGDGVHLHYIYTGDATELASLYSEGVEVKAFGGNSSLRRRVSKANNVPVAEISSGLPLKEKSMLDSKVIQSERGLRDLIARNLNKEFHHDTKSSIDFIAKILSDANRAGMVFDVTDLSNRIMVFANGSSNQALQCIKTVTEMQFKSDASLAEMPPPLDPENAPIVFFDIEVFPNLLLICWMYENSDTVVRMINPTPAEVEALFKFRLIGFNNREYDNHILWARFMGYNTQQLYELSKKIIGRVKGAKFGEAFNISYADIYDYTTLKQSLKKYENQLGIHHMELNLPWDDPADPSMWDQIGNYCENDVRATKAVHIARRQDFLARQIMGRMSGMGTNATTRQHATKLLFGKNRQPQEHFNYTDLSQQFPGYVFDPFSKTAKSTYRGEVVGEGGYVYAEPGMYENVTVLDIASMHPTSIVELDLFGKYTQQYDNLKSARLFIKHGDLASAIKLVPQLEGIAEDTPEALAALADALKLVLSSVYGYSYATFENAFRDPRNVDNVVAKRGSLFMIDLKNAVQAEGFQVVHIKTDSIKIPNATPEIIQFVMDFGMRFGYDFEFEDLYLKFCLVNDSVYIADVAEKKTEKKVIPRHWKPTGAQFAQPVVFKGLFSGEFIQFPDLCLTKEVKDPAALYLDFNESLANPNNPYEGMRFVGRTGMFVPVNPWLGGAQLVRVVDGVPHAVGGTKGYVWLEADMIKTLNLDAVGRMTFEDMTWALEGEGSIIDIVDMTYFTNMINDAIATIEKFGSFEYLVGTDKAYRTSAIADAHIPDISVSEMAEISKQNGAVEFAL